ncbi:hypothetical protein F2Q69_00022301 [Brassica cretica]|uniref:Methyltransferase n=1 Tax=Brassica cretica TaxID=69181 RepID=A0A8S9Q069_BRACR|nr:hypothetical protein F2Q69_00022301 [Brassica cretica]
MDRILRPEGTVVMRDNVETLTKVERITKGMKWNTQIVDHGKGPYNPEKILVAVKTYWTETALNSNNRPNTTLIAEQIELWWPFLIKLITWSSLRRRQKGERGMTCSWSRLDRFIQMNNWRYEKPARQLDFTGGSDEMLLTQIFYGESFAFGTYCDGCQKLLAVRPHGVKDKREVSRDKLCFMVKMPTTWLISTNATIIGAVGPLALLLLQQPSAVYLLEHGKQARNVVSSSRIFSQNFLLFFNPKFSSR